MTQRNLVLILAGIVLLAVVGGGILVLNRPPASPTVTNVSSTTLSSSASTTDTATNSSVTSATAGSYIAYSSNNLTPQKNVIFFAAAWCPSCQEFDRNLRAAEQEIPSNLTILKADYDTEISLRQKYGITLQHTYVQVNQNGDLLKKWNGLYTINSLEGVLVELI